LAQLKGKNSKIRGFADTFYGGNDMETFAYPEFFSVESIKKENWERVEKKIEALVTAMTLEEKMSLLHGWLNPEMVGGQIGNAGYLPGVPRLGVPEIRMYDGPAGVTSARETTGLPNPIVLASTWDDDLAYQFGRVAARENASVGGNHQLGTQVDIIRSPHFGRNKDMKGEDPYLSARLGVAEVKGVRNEGVAGVLKHYAAANYMSFGEPVDGILDEQTLHELYLRGFEESIIKGEAASVMNSYNFINGSYTTNSSYLNIHVLRNLWSFKGSVMSDWGANHNMTLGKGMDMEMPFDAYNTPFKIMRGIQKGDITWEDVDNGVRHVLGSLGLTGLLQLVVLDDAGKVKEEAGRLTPIRMAFTYDQKVKAGMLEEDGQVALEIARKGIVLAKNDGKTLPLVDGDFSGGGKTALLGLGALYPICGEGQERSYGVLEKMQSPHDHIKAMVKDSSGLAAAAVIDWVGTAIPSECLFQDPEGTNPGVLRTHGVSQEDEALVLAGSGPGGAGLEFFGFGSAKDEYGEPVINGLANSAGISRAAGANPGKKIGEAAGIDKTIDFTCGTGPDSRVVKNYRNGLHGSAITGGERYTWKAYLKAPETGDYRLKLEAIGGIASFLIQVDGQWRSVGRAVMREGTQWPWDTLICTPEGMGINTSVFSLNAGQLYPIIIFGENRDKNKDLQIRAAWLTPSQAQENYGKGLEEAGKASKVVLFLHNSSETGWMMDMLQGAAGLELPEGQKKLFNDVYGITSKTGAKLITVIQGGNARALGDITDKSDAVILTYYAGQEGARALSEILLGRVNPSGKLAESWPRQNEDTPLSDSVEHEALRHIGVRLNGSKTLFFSEGIFTGYRWYERYGIKPLFAFGHGLSYTQFTYSGLSITEEAGLYKAGFEVTNTGEKAGDEIVQLYLGEGEVPAHMQAAKKQLAGFIRIKDLAPGEKRRVSISIEKKSLCYWNPAINLIKRDDETKDKWEEAYGKRHVYIAASSEDIRLTGTIEVKPPEAEKPRRSF
jgi:beta-glucosidase-like glycosyl hydrolase